MDMPRNYNPHASTKAAEAPARPAYRAEEWDAPRDECGACCGTACDDCPPAQQEQPEKDIPAPGTVEVNGVRYFSVDYIEAAVGVARREAEREALQELSTTAVRRARKHEAERDDHLGRANAHSGAAEVLRRLAGDLVN
jgi:hypothetical protein